MWIVDPFSVCIYSHRLKIRILRIFNILKIHEFFQILKCQRILKIKFVQLTLFTKSTLPCKHKSVLSSSLSIFIIIYSVKLNNNYSEYFIVNLTVQRLPSLVQQSTEFLRILTNFKNLVKFANFT